MRVAVFLVAASMAAGSVCAQPATPEEVQNPLLVLRNLPHAPSHDRIQVRHYDFKELGAPSEYQLFVPSKYDAARPTPLIVLLHCLQCPPQQFIRSTGGPAQLEAIPKMPVIVIQGDADRLVRVDAARKWVDEMKSLGMTYEYIEVPGGDHMTPFIRTAENMRKVFDFLDAHPKK
jgi:pimeloyl-ACP methyl ester carboxylesterase